MVRRVDLDSDFEAIQAWSFEYGSTLDKDLLPPVGFIVPGVAAYFVYKVEGTKLVYLENLISNPKIAREIKDLGIQAVLSAALKYCNENGIKVAKAMTTIPKVVQRALEHKANKTEGYTLLDVRFKQ